MDIETLLALIRQYWPDRFEKGRVLHIHKNDVKMPDGSTRHLRVMLQTVSEPIGGYELTVIHGKGDGSYPKGTTVSSR